MEKLMKRTEFWKSIFVNLSVISILSKCVAVICNKMNVVRVKLHKTSASIAFIKKVISNELTPKLAIIKEQ